MLDEPDAIERVRAYAALGKDFCWAAQQKIWNADKRGHSFLLKFMGELENETQKDIYRNLTNLDAFEIQRNGGHIYQEVWKRMLDVFPQAVSKEILLDYAQECSLWTDTLLKILDVFGKEDAKELILAGKFMPVDLMGGALKVFTKEEVKELIINVAKNGGVVREESELKVLRVFDLKDAKEILKACATNLTGLSNATKMRIFSEFPKKDVKELLMLAIKNDDYLGENVLVKIIESFPKKDAKQIVGAFFRGNAGRNYYEQEDRDRILAQI